MEWYFHCGELHCENCLKTHESNGIDHPTRVLDLGAIVGHECAHCRANVPQQESKPTTRVVFEGDSVRVSVKEIPVCRVLPDGGGMPLELTPTQLDPANGVRSSVIIEKYAGENAFGEKQWTVVKDPHPQLFEVCEKFVEVDKVTRKFFDEK